MKKSFLFLIGLFCTLLSYAQSELLIHQSDKGLYLKHTVAAKENYYSIGRLYHIAPKEIESYNGLDMTKGLNVGQEVRIPLSAANFSQSADGGRAVYYIVGEKEGLYRVSVKNGNVLMANLRKWNKLTNDQLTTGKKMIVGYLAASDAAPATTTPAPAVAEKKVPEQPKEVQVAEAPKEKRPEPVEAKQVEKKPELPAPATQSRPQVAITDGNGGYFKASYEKQVKANGPSKNEQTGTAGIFKTASGWSDQKYYALIDGVEPGTIIRIINPTNGKAVYAKVLGEMSGIRQNQGYDVRMSNAAASALEVTDTEKFVVRLNF